MKRLPLLIVTMICCLGPVRAEQDDDMVSDRIDFSSSSIMGQANDFGAVYLTHRKSNHLDSLLSIRSNYRLEILFELDYQPVDEAGKAIEAVRFGPEGFEPGFEPVVEAK